MTELKTVFCWDVTVRAGFRCEPHRHRCTEVVYSDQAVGTLHQDAQEFSYHDRSVFVYQPGAEHWIANELLGTHICLGLQGRQAQKLKPGMYQATSALADRFEEIRAVHAQVGELRQERLSLLGGLVACDLGELHQVVPPMVPDKPEQIRQHIDQNLAQPLGSDELAALACVNRDYLRQLFRQAYGESLRSYINRRRLERAAELLRTTDEKVRHIGGYVGIDNEFYFSRLFKQRYGNSPTSYRSQHRELL